LSQPAYLVGIFTWLFVVILGSALSVVRHADQLAVRLGEPYGTLILTLSVTIIEVASITAIMLHGENNPTLPSPKDRQCPSQRWAICFGCAAVSEASCAQPRAA
jgi:hypothetical protein